MTSVEFKNTFQVLDLAEMIQANKDFMVPMKSNMCTTISRVRDFTRMNPTKFYGSKVEKILKVH